MGSNPVELAKFVLSGIAGDVEGVDGSEKVPPFGELGFGGMPRFVSGGCRGKMKPLRLLRFLSCGNGQLLRT